MLPSSEITIPWLLILSNLALVVWFVWRRCVSPRGIEINHILTASIGFVAYWLLPFMVGLLRLFADNPATGLYYSFFDGIAFDARLLYLCCCLLSYAAFVIGTETCIARHAGEPRPIYRAINFPLSYLNLHLLIGTAFIAVTAWSMRADFFHDYSETIGNDDRLNRSMFTSATGILLALAFVYSIKREERLRTKDPDHAPAFGKVIRNRAVLAYGVTALLTLSTGQRLGVLSGILMFLAYRSVYFTALRFRTAAAAAGGLFGLAGIVGLSRLGGGLNIMSLLFNVFAEPIGCGQTLVAFLQAGRLELFNFPSYLLNGFVNLIPRPLYPDKETLLLSPAQQGYVVFAPLGSLHNFVQFCINFGLIGTIVVWFFLGYGLQRLKQNDKSLLHRTAYVMIAGFLATTFFRDDFSMSIVKAMLQLSVILPLAFAFSANLFKVYLYPNAAPAQAAVPAAGQPTG